MSASAHRLGLLAAALVASGCSYARQCTVPDASLPPPPGPPLPARVGVAYLDDLAEDSLDLQVSESSYRFPVGAAAVSALNRAAPQLFQGVVPAARRDPVEGGPEAVLSFRLDSVNLRPGPFKAESAQVKLSAWLRDRHGEVARTTVSAEAEGLPIHYAGLLHCDSAGAAIGAAMSAAVARARDELGASPVVAAWLRDPVREPPVAGGPAPPPLPEAVQPPASEERFRNPLLPRYLELDLVHGTTRSDAAGLETLDGWGWGLRTAWGIGEYVALGLHAGGTTVTVGWTPLPGVPTDRAELAFVGLEVLVRARPGRTLRPWVGLTVAYQSLAWSSYAESLGGGCLVGSAGLDVVSGPWGALRLGLSATASSATMSSGSSSGVPPPGDGGAVGMRSLWLGAGWLFDLGPAR